MTQNNVKVLRSSPRITPYAKHITTECLHFGECSCNIFDERGDGLSACFKDGSSCAHSLALNNHAVLLNDGSFSSEQRQIFGICLNNACCYDGDPCTRDTCDALNRVCRHDIDCSNFNKVAVTIGANADLCPHYFKNKNMLICVPDALILTN